ncbi:MAG: AAA family ATPase [Candidatus Hermodarchaeota archaeon]
MLLKRIELENIKTHKNTSIPFNEGLNVLHGDNGTGKSTVLEMIGYLLFDYLDINKHEIYVRDIQNDKPEFGTVRLWIIGKNNEPFIIERAIGKTSVAVRSVLTNKLLNNVNSVSKLKKWIRNQIGVDSNVQLDKLFKTSIGIPQGTFINPFLEDPTGKKRYFDPILNIEVYRTMWEKLGSLISAYNSDLQDIREQIQELKGEIKNKSDIVLKHTKVTTEVEDLKKQLKDILNKAKEVKYRFEELKLIKSKFETAQQDKVKLQFRHDNEKQSQTSLQKQLDESQDAKKICAETLESYNEYEALSRTIKSLQAKIINLPDKRELLESINQKYNDSNLKIIQVNQKINEAQEALDNIKLLKTKYEKYESLETEIQKLQDKMTRITALEEDVEIKQDKVNTHKSRIFQLNKEIEQIPELEHKFENLEILEKNLYTLQNDCSILNNDINLIYNYQQALESGECPFFHQTCKNIEQGIADLKFLSNERYSKEKLLEGKRLEIDKLRKKVEGKEDLGVKIKDLKEKLGVLKESENSLHILQEEINKSKDIIQSKSKLIKELSKLEKSKLNLIAEVEDYQFCKKRAEILPELQEELALLKPEFNKLEEKKKNLELEIGKLEKIFLEITNNRKRLDLLEADYEEYQRHIKIAQKCSELQNNYQITIHNLQDLNKKIKDTSNLISMLLKDYDEEEFQAMDTQIRDYENIRSRHEALISEKQERLSELNTNLTKIELNEKQIANLSTQEDNLEVQQLFIDKLRKWIREFIPKMRKALINKINVIASEIYRNLREEEDTILTWKEDYDIEIISSKITKNFFRLSGGERMSAALAVRLAILKILTNVKFAFFDEPTSNLDPPSRTNLSKYIYNIKGFRQLFVISHDDSFKRHSEYVIKFTKDDNEITHIDYLTKKGEKIT